MTQSQAIRIALAASAGYPDAEDRFVASLNRNGYDITCRATVLPFHPRSSTAMLTTGSGRPISPFSGDAA